MRIVIDTNIVFSAILNTNSKIGRIILQPRTPFNFYATELLLTEINEHKAKIMALSDFTEIELDRIIQLITKRIRFINVNLIPNEVYVRAENLTKEIDIDDTEFVALVEHLKGRLWSGDKELRKGLAVKAWNKFITTDELYKKLIKDK